MALICWLNATERSAIPQFPIQDGLHAIQVIKILHDGTTLPIFDHFSDKNSELFVAIIDELLILSDFIHSIKSL